MMNPPSSSEPRVSLRDRFRAATRDAILDAAAGLLNSERASHVRMEDIAAKAGIAVGTLYNYFADRAALVNALLDTRRQRLLAKLDSLAVPAARAETPTAAFSAELAAFVATVADHFNSNRRLMAIMIEEDHLRGVDAKRVSRRRTVSGELLARAERLMAKGLRIRALRKGEPSTYAALLVGMAKGVGDAALDRGEELKADAAAEIVQVFMTGAAR